MLCVLIDTRSIHNFINSNMAIKLGCIMEPILELKVLDANGEELKCREVCKAFTWVMQGQSYRAEVLSLPLRNYDLVLGIQWLVELGDILWNFKDLQMGFKVGNTECMLQGNKRSQLPMFIMFGEKMSKMLEK